VDLINLTGAVPDPLGKVWIVSRSLCLRESCMRYVFSRKMWRLAGKPTGINGTFALDAP